MKRYVLVDRYGRKYEVENQSADDYRLNQMLNRWLPAGQVCCYLGVPNPFGFGANAELTEVRLTEK